jgi:hypothetical protein
MKAFTEQPCAIPDNGIQLAALFHRTAVLRAEDHAA